MRNKINYILLQLCLGFSLSSCSYFDSLLDEKTDSTLSLLETLEQCDYVLNGMKQSSGIYTYLLDDDYEILDIENMYGVRGNKLTELYYMASFEFVKNDKSKEGLVENAYWENAYKDIWNTNVVLENIDHVKGSNDVLRDQVKGEAYLMRAYSHYMLCKNYGIQYNSNAVSNPGVPLSLSFDSKAELPRASVEEVYAQVEQDIKSAMQYLSTEKQNAATTYRGSIVAAKALLMKVYLDKAVVDTKYYNEVIKLGEEILQVDDFLYDYNLSEDLDEATFVVFNNREVIMNRMLEKVENQYNLLLNTHISGYPFLVFTPGAELADNDLRRVYTYSDAEKTLGRTTMKFGLKFETLTLLNFGLTNAEVYLNLMEAYIRNNEANKALPLFNKLKANRYENYTDAASVSLDDVKEERRKEFIGVGFRFYDIKRYRALGEYTKPIIRTNKLGVETGRLDDDSHFVLPIPLKILRLNSNIKQNIYK